MYLLISKNASIKGIKINECEYKISQYAEDTTLILDGSSSLVSAALNTIEYFVRKKLFNLERLQTKLKD